MPKPMWLSTIMGNGVKTLISFQKRVVLISATNTCEPVKGKWLKIGILFLGAALLIVNFFIFNFFCLSQR